MARRPTRCPSCGSIGTDAARFDLLRWGLIPYWAKDKSIGPRCINAMVETVATKPVFRDAYQRRRCLVRIPTIVDSDSDRSRTLIPIEGGQGFR
jgi:hypothetical protein